LSAPNPLRELLNRHRWHSKDLERLTIVVRMRGAPGDERAVSGKEVLDIQAAGLLVEDQPGEAIDDGYWFLPYHRVVRVEGPNGTIWQHPVLTDQVMGRWPHVSGGLR
jgi:uncharacterized protein (UPF0248 family)